MSAPDIISTARTVLSDPDFQTTFPPAQPVPEQQPPPEWLKSLFQAIIDFLKWLLDLLPDGSGLSDLVNVVQGQGDTFQVILLIVLLFLAVVATVIAYRWIAPRIRQLKTGSPTGQDTDGQPKGAEHHDLLSTARKLIDAGDLDAAAACLFRAALGSVLDEEDRREHRSQTARHLVSQLQGDEPTRHLLQRLVGVREAVHYAGRASSPQEFESLYADVSALIRRHQTV